MQSCCLKSILVDMDQNNFSRDRYKAGFVLSFVHITIYHLPKTSSYWLCWMLTHFSHANPIENFISLAGLGLQLWSIDGLLTGFSFGKGLGFWSVLFACLVSMVFGFISFAHTGFYRAASSMSSLDWYESWNPRVCSSPVVFQMASELVVFLVIGILLGIYLGHQVMFFSLFNFCPIDVILFFIMHVYKAVFLCFFLGFFFLFIFSCIYLVSSFSYRLENMFPKLMFDWTFCCWLLVWLVWG